MAWRAARWFGLVLVGGALFLAMGQVDAVLGRMSAIGGEQGSGLGFPWSGAQAEAAIGAWQRYQAEYGPMADTVSMHPPQLLHLWLFLLDLAFIAVYAVVLLLSVRAARRQLTAGDPDPSQDLARARLGLLRWAGRLLVALVVVDVVEDVLLLLAYGLQVHGLGAVGPWVTAAKWVLAVVVVAPILLAWGVAYVRGRALRRALAGARGVLVVVAILALLLVVLPLGAQQVDDVIRAWSVWSGLWAVLATALAAWVVVGAARELTETTAERNRPDDGADPQDALLVAALVTAAVGGLAWFAFHAWGLFVPAVLLLIIWAGGWLVRPVRDRGESGAVQLRSRVGGVFDAVLERTPAEPLPEPDPEDPTPQEVTAAGRQVAHVLGTVVCLVPVWVLVRASAYDLLVVRPSSVRVGWLLVVIGAVLVVAAMGFVVATTVTSALLTRRVVWLPGTVLALVLLWVTLVDADATAVGLPLALGTVAVVMTGVAAGAGGLAGVAVVVRRSGVGRFRLARALRLLGLRRFPAIAMVLVWALAVALIDPGGFHDARRTAVAPGTAPSLAQAYQTWLAAGPTSGARPMVMVAAQGGGIRAAIWTALVMECVFGPTPVEGGDGVCAGNDGATRLDEPLPVFAASGTSGGSLGLAEWSARRLDLTQPPGSVAGIPSAIDDVLPDDYLAPELARLLSGDALYLLLAHDQPDRAALLERTFERSWGAADGGGPSRGLRAAYELANGDGEWRIPVLALNGSQVEDGCRFVSSPVDLLLPRRPGAPITGDDDRPDDATCGTGPEDPGYVDALPRTNELIDYLCPGQDVPLSTAAHLSARFPYVSPTARISAEDCADSGAGPGRMPPGAVSFLTDGGTYDNSGASTALGLWRALQPEVSGSCVVPLFLQIDNEPADESGNTTTRPPLELVAPVSGIWSRFGGLEAAERAAAQQAFGAVRTADGRTVGPGSAWFRIVPSVQPGIEPPVGWTLAAETVDDLRRQLVSDPNRDAIRRLRALLDTPRSC